MMTTKPTFAGLVSIAIATFISAPASASIDVNFIEGAPKDRFVITNMADCDIENKMVTINLEGSDGKLIFDTTNRGAGVEVFQPFELVAGKEYLASVPTVSDGQKAINFDVKALPKGKSVAFTIDVDDTIGQREITVSGSEISGAFIEFEGEKALFTSKSMASLSVNICS